MQRGRVISRTAAITFNLRCISRGTSTRTPDVCFTPFTPTIVILWHKLCQDIRSTFVRRCTVA